MLGSSPAATCHETEVWTCVDPMSIHCQYITTSAHDRNPETGSTCVAGPISRTAEGTKQWLCGSARPQVKTCPWRHHRQKESSDSSRRLSPDPLTDLVLSGCRNEESAL